MLSGDNHPPLQWQKLSPGSCQHSVTAVPRARNGDCTAHPQYVGSKMHQNIQLCTKICQGSTCLTAHGCIANPTSKMQHACGPGSMTAKHTFSRPTCVRSSTLHSTPSTTGTAHGRHPLEAASVTPYPKQHSGSKIKPVLGLPRSSSSQQTLVVCTDDGAKGSVRVLPGLTTVAQIRAEVAHKTGTDPSQLRLSYAGQELQDSCSTVPALFALKPGYGVISAVQRLQAGGTDDAAQAGAESATVQHMATEATPPAAEAQQFRPRTGRRTAPFRPTREDIINRYSGTSSNTRDAAVTTTAEQHASQTDRQNSSTGSSSIKNGSAPPALGTMTDHQFIQLLGGTAEPAPTGTPALPQPPQLAVMEHMRQQPGTAEKQQRGVSAAVWAATSPDVKRRRRNRDDIDTVPGGRRGASAEVQLAWQFRDLMKNPIPGVSVAPSDDNLFLWNVQLSGPEGTPYEGGWFDVLLHFTKHFPGEQPAIYFTTKIWHPNIDPSDGQACLALGKGPAGLSGVCSIACVLAGLQMLLGHPNPDNPYYSKAAYQILHEPEEFEQQAREWTQPYAM